jgi:hypothetical protein
LTAAILLVVDGATASREMRLNPFVRFCRKTPAAGFVSSAFFTSFGAGFVCFLMIRLPPNFAVRALRE